MEERIFCVVFYNNKTVLSIENIAGKRHETLRQFEKRMDKEAKSRRCEWRYGIREERKESGLVEEFALEHFLKE